MGNDHHWEGDTCHRLRGIGQRQVDIDLLLRGNVQLLAGICQRGLGIGQCQQGNDRQELGSGLHRLGSGQGQLGNGQYQVGSDQYRAGSGQCRVGICQQDIGQRLLVGIGQTGSGLIRRRVCTGRRDSDRRSRPGTGRLGTDPVDGRCTGHRLGTGRHPGSDLRLAGIGLGRRHYYHLKIKNHIKIGHFKK